MDKPDNILICDRGHRYCIGCLLAINYGEADISSPDNEIRVRLEQLAQSGADLPEEMCPACQLKDISLETIARFLLTKDNLSLIKVAKMIRNCYATEAQLERAISLKGDLTEL